MEKMSVAEVLDALMRSWGLGPSELSRRTGVDQTTISRIRNGKIRDPKDAIVSKLAAYFGESVEAMRGREPLSSGVRTPAPPASSSSTEPQPPIDSARRLLLKATDGMSDEQLLALLDAANMIRRGATYAPAGAHQSTQTTTEIFSHHAVNAIDERFRDELFLSMGVPKNKIASAKRTMISWFVREADERHEDRAPPGGVDLREKQQAGA